MREVPEALAFAPGVSIAVDSISFASVLGNGLVACLVKASVQPAELVRRNVLAHVHSQIDDGLADIGITVHDLRHRDSLREKVVPVQDRGPASLPA
jgi:hypothetical protein